MKHFTIKELSASTSAAEKNIDNTPDATATTNLKALVEMILDPAREGVGRAINVSSGYRSPALNAAVGGAATSQHNKGEAADLTCGSRSLNKDLFDYIRNNLPFDQLIDERDYLWIHVSYKRSGTNRGEALRSPKAGQYIKA
ncbi:MAG: D-Ala-D-Ala carboxypeptidase family metallohydrolase [Rikenellaceae bacterium]